LTDEIFVKANGTSLIDAKTQTLHFGHIVDKNGEEIDEVMVSLFRSPHSYTGEDSTEISCHGSRYILNAVMAMLIEHGARQALPGEYTQRAFLNGKMDLSQAEAVADLIAATNRATHRMAMSQLNGKFSTALQQLRSQLLKLTSLLELEMDFSEEDVTFADRKKLHDVATEIRGRIVSLASSFRVGNALKSGIPVTIIGKTNVGKSTLLNNLIGDERAIVSDIHGTTRDVIEDTVNIQGITFRFIDTAGIRSTKDAIEKLGIERTLKKLSEAAIVIWMMDQPPTTSELSDIARRTEGKKLIKVFNKCDNNTENIPTDAIAISAKYDINVDRLKQELVEAADIPEITSNDIVITNVRHVEALQRASESIERVISGISSELSGDLLSEDLRDCIHHLSEILGGEITDDEILGNIFKNFCIGK
jgi:tRNA modification GTPase